MSRLINSAQRWFDKSPHLFIVEAQYRNVFRNTQAGVSDYVHHFNCSKVIYRKDCVGPLGQIDEVPGIFFNLRALKLCMQDVVVVYREMMLLQRIHICQQAVSGVIYVLGAGNEGDTPRVSTVSVVDSNWPAALLEIASQILGERPQEG